VFGKEHCVQSHHQQWQLRKHHLYFIGVLFEIEIELYPHPYTTGWIKKDPCINVMNLCQVPISIAMFSQDLVTCDVADMDACHILLG